MNYGPNVLKKTWLDTVPRLKNRFMSQVNESTVKRFHRLSEAGWGARLFSHTYRRMVGPHLNVVKIEINRACNLACKMCYVEHKGSVLPMELIERLFKDIRGAGVRIDILGGEPLMHKNIVEIVQNAKQVAQSPIVTVYTNATFATPDLARKLKTAGLDVAIVNIANQDNKLHDDFVGKKGAWDKTVKGIQAFRDAGVMTFSFTAVHSHNFNNCENLHDFVRRDLKAQTLFAPYIPQSKNDPLMLEPETWKETKRWVLFESNKEHGAYIRDVLMITGNACEGGYYMLTVKVDGSVQPCPFVEDVNLGDLRNSDIWTIYQNRFDNPEFQEFKCVPDECSSCTYVSVCGGGCRAGNRRLFGTYASPDHRCLGPHTTAFNREEVCDRIPSFF